MKAMKVSYSEALSTPLEVVVRQLGFDDLIDKIKSFKEKEMMNNAKSK